MVLAERNSELVRNGRRSRGPSPNGHASSATVLGGTGNTGAGAVSVGSNSSSLSVMGGASGTLLGSGGGGGGGNGTPDTSSDDDNSIKRNGKSKKQSEYEEKIRVGRDYQAVCPPLVPEMERKPEGLNERALLVWSPTKEIPDNKLEEYISVAKEKYGYNGEQALGMLFWHKHDLERAVMDLSNFTPFPDEWTVEDKVLFDQAFQFHGKSFHRIRQMLPDKSIASLVKYYYSWKKTRHRQSTMDKHEKAKASKEGSENGSENGSNEESDEDKDHVTNMQEQNKCNNINNNNHHNDIIDGNDDQHAQQQNEHTYATKSSSGLCTGACGGLFGGVCSCQGGENGYCTNCGVHCNMLHPSVHGKLCESCHHHWRRTGEKRPISCPYKRMRGERALERQKRKPRNMIMNHDELQALASSQQSKITNDFLMNVERGVSVALTHIQCNKAEISALKKKNMEEGSDETLRAAENMPRINARWTNEEHMIAVEGVRKYGKDFQAIADLIGTKTEAHVRTFYCTNRRRHNLDQHVKKHEAEKEAAMAAAAAAVSASSGVKSEDVEKLFARLGGNSAGSSEIVSAKKEDEQIVLKKTADDQEKVIKANNDSNKSSTLLPANSNNSAAVLVKDDSTENDTTEKEIIMEIDSDVEQSESPPNKKLALNVNNQSHPEASAV